MSRRSLGLLAVAALAVAPLAACTDDDPAKGEAILEVDGAAVVVRQDGGEERITRRTDLRVGDEVTLVEGTGVLDLGDGASLELRAGAGEEADSRLVMGPIPVLEAGDVLATTAEEIGLSVDDTRVRIIAGSARASRSTGMEVAAYDADIELDSAGQKRTVPALREMSVPALGHPPAGPRPFEYDASDPWDRRFLGDAIELGQRLQALSEGYTQNLPDSTARTVAFYRGVLPGLADNTELTADLLDARRPVGDTLVGAAIVDLGRRGTFAERWSSVFTFRDAGAAWGLVALDQGVDGGPLVAAVTQAVESSLAIGPDDEPGGVTTTSAVVGTTPTTIRRPGTPGGSTTTTTLAQPGEPDGGGLLSPVLDPVTDLLSGLINGLLGGLLGS